MERFLEQKRKTEETFSRLTQPVHHRSDPFRAHQRIEGYFENRDVPDFMGSDRLLKIDGIYGTIQLGYNPQKGKTFLFANIKTSIYDTAPSRYQKELKEYQMMRQIKTGTPNIAFSSKRRNGGAALVYNLESKPWSAQSIAPYLYRGNMESLGKTMPFLDRTEELEERQKARDEKHRLQAEVRSALTKARYADLQALRLQERETLYLQNRYNSLIVRKDTAARLFFRRLNIAFDLQKQEIFQYYRGRRFGGEKSRLDSGLPENRNGDEGQDE
ncbi:hypothetical protein LJC63_00790 [Ruminococcaceae bacterium OttesenSCG-928-L11]|nr:hypothetical protein [Ruminococcaceae bacterium OttesenSCG-928-L11]